MGKPSPSAVPNLTLPSLAHTAGGPNVTVAASGSQTLAPGSYSTVKVKTKGKLLLSSGDYFIDILDMDASVVLSINASGPVNVYVVSNLAVDKSVQVQLTAGTSDKVLFASLQTNTLEVGASAMLYGNLIVPNAEAHFATDSKIKGAIFANLIKLDAKVKFFQHTSPGAFPKEEGEVDASEASDQSPVTSYQLEQNHPNPFNPSTVINFQLPAESEVSLKICNLQGQVVRELAHGQYTSGRYSVVWNATDDRGVRVASGVYLYVLKAGSFVRQCKLVVKGNKVHGFSIVPFVIKHRAGLG